MLELEKKLRVGGIMHWAHLAELGVMNVPDRPGVAAVVFRSLGEAGVNVPFIVQSIDLQGQTHIVLCVAEKDRSRAIAALQGACAQLGKAVLREGSAVALVSVFGPDFRERPGIAAAIFTALGNAGVNILAISTSISTVSCLVRNQDLPQALSALEAACDLP